MKPVAADSPHPVALSYWKTEVLLAWDEVRRGASTPGDGHNVVIHEFAHQLDQAGGPANGAPALASAEDYRRWSSVMQGEFDALQWRLAQGIPSLIDPYGATNPEEFFAVACEPFFECGPELQAWEPRLYAVMQRYFGVDTAQWV